jgi:hypothetical protein
VAIAIVYILCLDVIPAIICGLKGKPVFASLSLIGAFGIAGAICLAKPGSLWDRKFYGEDKHRSAPERFFEKKGYVQATKLVIGGPMPDPRQES